MLIYLKQMIMNNLTILYKSIKYNFLIYLRIKQAVFFTTFFPVFLFVIFGNIWGKSPDYIPFILTGLIGMTIASEGIFSIGSVISLYYTSGLIKYFKKLPFKSILHFLGLIISRIFSLFLTILILCLISFLVFDYLPSIFRILNYLLATIVGLTIFSFIGLSISFSNTKEGIEKGLSNLIYFIIIFTSMAFYPIKYFNKTFGEIGDYLPLNNILNLLRGDDINYYVLLFWLVIPILIFLYFFNRIKSTR